jgi:hypothetical protein
MLLVCAVCLLGGTADAQDLVPLAEAISRGSDETYQLKRCAALYLSTVSWAEGQLDQNVENEWIKIADAFLAVAVSKSTEKLGNDAAAVVNRDVLAIMETYLKRYQENYATAGQGFGEDPLWESDAQVCRMLSGR